MIFLPKWLKNLFLTVSTIAIVFITALSLAEEINLTSIMPEVATSSSGTYLIGDIDAALTITEGSPEGMTTFHTILWEAPLSGPILLTWHHPGLNVSAVGPGGVGWGLVNFAVRLNETAGLPGTTRALYARHFLDGFLPIPPISDVFAGTLAVEQGVEYTIDLQYLYSWFNNLEAELLNTPGKRSIIEITYVDVPRGLEKQ